MKRALITGVTGQDGSYLTEFLLGAGYHVHGIRRRSSSFNTERIDHLYDHPSFFLHYGDMTDATNVIRILQEVQPDEIYNLAAQSHVHVSFEAPEYTANADALGSLRLLEGIRILGMADRVRIYQASTSELYGVAREVPQTEATPFYPRSPYAAAKLYAYWITVNYREAYGMHASNGILFNHESLPFDTPVIYRRNGFLDIKPIGELVMHRKDPTKGKKYQTVPEELEVWDGTRWARVTLATATWKSDKEANIVAVNCRGAYYQATYDHISFLGGGVEIKTGDLLAGQTLTLKTLPAGSVHTTVSLEEAELLGMLVADGHLSEDGDGTFTKNDDVLREHVTALWRLVAGGYTTEVLGKSGYDTTKTVKKIKLNGNCAILRYWRGEMYTKHKFKRIPARILNASEEARRAFLTAYNTCDGLKGGHNLSQELKSFTTNSAILAQGLYLLCTQFGYRVTLHPEIRDDILYHHININVKDSIKGQHLIKPLNEIKAVTPIPYEGWVFDLATESGTFSAGVGLGWIHNSPRRGETFVTRKITQGVASIWHGKMDCLYLGNLDAKRDWGHARDFVEAMWLILQQPTPDDYVIATGETHTVREFVERAFAENGIFIEWAGQGTSECGICHSTSVRRPELLGQTLVRIDPKYFRPTEVAVLHGDPTKAREKLGWEPRTTFSELIEEMVDHDMNYIGGFNVKVDRA